MMIRWANAAIRALATMAIGSSGGFEVISQRAHSGAVPPGAGRSSTASPPQTKLMPSVTTMEGRLRRWMITPSPA